MTTADYETKETTNYSMDQSVEDSLSYIAASQTGMFQSDDTMECFRAKAEGCAPKFDDLGPLRKGLWPNGIQEGFSDPLALLLDQGPETLQVANDHGFRHFTSAEAFKRYVESEVMALTVGNGHSDPS